MICRLGGFAAVGGRFNARFQALPRRTAGITDYPRDFISKVTGRFCSDFVEQRIFHVAGLYVPAVMPAQKEPAGKDASS